MVLTKLYNGVPSLLVRLFYAICKVILQIMIHEMKIYKRTYYNRPGCYVIGIFPSLILIALHTGFCYVSARSWRLQCVLVPNGDFIYDSPYRLFLNWKQTKLRCTNELRSVLPKLLHKEFIRGVHLICTIKHQAQQGAMSLWRRCSCVQARSGLELITHPLFLYMFV